MSKKKLLDYIYNNIQQELKRLLFNDYYLS